jgi:hypothetical protein
MTERKKTGRKWTAELDAVGLRFRWKRDGRKMLKTMAEKSPITGIRLVREPDNKYDANAIMVLLPERIINGSQLGYLPAVVAEKLAPALDAGTTEVASAKLIEISGEKDDFNTATLIVIFRDKPANRIAKPKGAKRKKELTS